MRRREAGVLTNHHHHRVWYYSWEHQASTPDKVPYNILMGMKKKQKERELKRTELVRSYNTQPNETFALSLYRDRWLPRNLISAVTAA